MTNTRVARRYAEALIALAEEQKIIERVVQDLEILRSTARESKEFFLFLKSPVINKEKKREILDALFAKKLQPPTMLFIHLLAEKGREDVLLTIIEQFLVLRDDRLGIVPVDVKSATDLGKEQNAEMQRRFEGYTKKKVRISHKLEPDLKGGFVARVGDTVFDGSIKRQLELMREQFALGAI